MVATRQGRNLAKETGVWENGLFLGPDRRTLTQ